MKNLAKLLESQRRIRVLGLDDSHSAKVKGSVVNVAGVVCIDTRFEGMLWNELSYDGLDATDRMYQMVVGSKFAPLLHLILTDGISFGGSNIVELPVLAKQLKVPVVAVMRKYPNLEHFRYVLNQLSEPEERWRRVRAAGAIHQIDGWVFQCVGEDPAIVAQTLTRLTDRGKVPEALRLAHLIGAAIKFGESTKRA